MIIHIRSDGGPIYQQIVDQIRFRILSGQLAAGAELPTIRGFAESLKVNPNTVARAYRELEHEGLVEKRRTTGTYVSDSPPKIGAARRRKVILPEIDKLLALSDHLGFTPDELTQLIESRHENLNRKESRS